jgi:RIO kinase 1
MKAIQHKSGFGQYVSHQSWMAHEVATLDLLNDAGAPVPRVYSKSDNAILMSYIGNEQEAAPTLNNVNLTALHNGKEIYELFHKAIGCIELLLQHDRIHGDLSAYNILYWAGDITLIDFPQTIVASRNSQAQDILRRDVQRVCEYFQKQGVRCRPIPLADALWHQYVALSDMEREADLSRFEVEED